MALHPRHGIRASTTLALAVATALSGAAHAQQVASTSTLEEVVVTAERREVNLQDVPASATVMTANSLAAD